MIRTTVAEVAYSIPSNSDLCLAVFKIVKSIYHTNSKFKSKSIIKIVV